MDNAVVLQNIFGNIATIESVISYAINSMIGRNMASLIVYSLVIGRVAFVWMVQVHSDESEDTRVGTHPKWVLGALGEDSDGAWGQRGRCHLRSIR